MLYALRMYRFLESKMSAPHTNISKQYQAVTIAISFVSLAPLMLVHTEMWDGVFQDVAFSSNDLSFLDRILWMGRYITYYVWYLFQEISLATGIPHKAFTNTLSVLSIIGISRETYKYIRDRFSLTPTAACIGSWFVLAFPAWHVFISGANSDYILFTWLFMMAVNLREKKRMLALVLLCISLQFYSLFAFAIGFACVDFIMSADKHNYRKKALSVILFSATLLVGFILLKALININGANQTDNTFKLDGLQYIMYFVALSAVLLSGWTVLRFKSHDAANTERYLRLLLSFLALSFFACLAYWAIGRPMRFFSFGSYTSRHTILCCIPLAMAIGVAANYALQNRKENLVKCLSFFFVTAFIVILYQGYDHKIAAIIYKEMMIESFEAIPEPESGYISIAARGYQAPRHFQAHDTNHAMYKAYGKAAWLANGFWARRGHIYTFNDLKNLYSESLEKDLKWVFGMDVTGDKYTSYDFIVENYHQEGRFWYWLCYLYNKYDVFNARLVKH